MNKWKGKKSLMACKLEVSRQKVPFTEQRLELS